MSKKRFRWLIYPKFQMTLILANIGLVSLCMLVFGLELLRTFNNLKDIGRNINLPANHAFFNFIDWQLNSILLTLSAAYLLAVGFSTLATLIISHRLAGPIVRMRGYFQEIAKTGHIEKRLSFRKKDFFNDLPEDINQALDKVSNKNN